MVGRSALLRQHQGAQGVYLCNGPGNAQILGNAITDVRSTKSAKGVFIGDSTTTSSSGGVMISENTVSNITSSKGAHDVLVNNGNGDHVGASDLTIEENSFTLRTTWPPLASSPTIRSEGRTADEHEEIRLAGLPEDPYYPQEGESMKKLIVLAALVLFGLLAGQAMAGPPGHGGPGGPPGHGGHGGPPAPPGHGGPGGPPPPNVVYDALPADGTPNVASLGFEATSTSEFGDYVHLGGNNRLLKTVTITMSDWALYSTYSSDPRYEGNSSTWSWPITVNIYSNHLGANGVPDRLIASVTQDTTIPWRPPSGGCTDPTAWLASDGSCNHGIAFNATFDLSSQNITLPNDIIVGVAYNTGNYGAHPVGANGPYNSLNVGVADNQAVSAGTDDNTDAVYWDTTYPGHSAGFRQDTGWAPNGTVNMQITADPVHLNLDRNAISDKACNVKGSKPIVDVTYQLTNDADSGFAGNNWATDTLNRHMKIWSESDGTYCVRLDDNGQFTTVAGDSPSSFSTVSAGVTGQIHGGYVTNDFTATLSSTPAYATHGNLGSFDATAAHPSFLSYFDNPGSIAWSQPAWGWIYTAGPNGTWLNQYDVPKQSSGDISG